MKFGFGDLDFSAGAEAPAIMSAYTQGIKDYADGQAAIKKLQEIDNRMGMEAFDFEQKKKMAPIIDQLQLQKVNVMPGSEPLTMETVGETPVVSDLEADLMKSKESAKASVAAATARQGATSERQEDSQRFQEQQKRITMANDDFKNMVKKHGAARASSPRKKAQIIADYQALVENDVNEISVKAYKRFEETLKEAGIKPPYGYVPAPKEQLQPATQAPAPSDQLQAPTRQPQAQGGNASWKQGGLDPSMGPVPQGPQQTRIINGVQYVKVPGGWARAQK